MKYRLLEEQSNFQTSAMIINKSKKIKLIVDKIQWHLMMKIYYVLLII